MFSNQFHSFQSPLRGIRGVSRDESRAESGRDDGKSMGGVEMFGMWQSGEEPDSSDGEGGEGRLLEVHRVWQSQQGHQVSDSEDRGSVEVHPVWQTS